MYIRYVFFQFILVLRVKKNHTDYIEVSRTHKTLCIKHDTLALTVKMSP